MEASVRVAILLATYNGARYVDTQIHSLARNSTRFTLHWLDDHSSDSTRAVVRAAALKARIDLREWHQPQHVGVPLAFFRLIECVDADIYLFADQDDIWQPGKIDSAVAKLLPLAASPALCFSEFSIFQHDDVSTQRALRELVGEDRLRRGVLQSRMFTPQCVAGHSQAFTRPLRDLYLSHKEIAHEYAFMHDFWLYHLAIACGAAHFMRDVPTTLYRRHPDSYCQRHLTGGRKKLSRNWRFAQLWRRVVARHARGFLLAADTLPAGPHRDFAIDMAGRFAVIDHRQSALAMTRLAVRGALWSAPVQAAWFLLACLYSDARRSPTLPRHGSAVAADL